MLNDIALLKKSSQSYGVSLAIWDHTVLPVTLHKWTQCTYFVFLSWLVGNVSKTCYNVKGFLLEDAKLKEFSNNL